MDLAEEPTRTPQKPNLPARPANTKAMQRNGQFGGLTPQDIINYINPKATEQEAYLFCEFCKRKGADPMTKQVYLVIYEGQNGRQANFIAGKEYFTEKAEAHPQFDGFEAGVIVRREGNLERRQGTFWIPAEEQLVGGWATVHRKDRKTPACIEVPLADYDTKKNLWAKMPATMIRKVAIVQTLRESFPSAFGGMYDRSEMDQAIEADYEVGA
jgi:phage recombination protein Bet